MIARHEGYMDKADIWAKLAAPLPNGVVSWRQDGKIIARDGRFFARYVAYVDANTVRDCQSARSLPRLPMTRGFMARASRRR